MKKQKERKSWIRPVILTAALCIGFTAGVPGHNAVADDTGDDGYTPAFANPAQARHAANIAEAVAAEPDAATLDALSAVEDAEAALKEAEETGNEQAIEAARIRLAEAEQAYADVIEARLGVITSEIEAMRNADMGWGEIARELGVHPSVLGLGHTKARQNKYGRTDDTMDGDEVAEATERNIRTGWSQGHGLGLNAGVKDTVRVQGGYALGRMNKDKKADGGISGAAGLSGGGQGNGGGSGKGNSSGKDSSGVGSDGGPGKSDKGKSQGGSGKSNGNSGGKGNSGK